MADDPSLTTPSVVIAGGGPAGLVAAIMLAKHNMKATVVERSEQPDPWSSKSYSIVLGEKGTAALQRAGVLEQAEQAGMKRANVFIHKEPDGRTITIPKQFKNSLGFSRPLLVECLEKHILERYPELVTIKRGVGIQSVNKTDNELMKIELDDGSVLHCTHVIGADGKWSKVRASCFPDLSASIRVEPSFGVQIMADSVPEGWRDDGTHVMKPANEEDCKFHIIAAPIPTGEFSISLVCYDETLERYPWLAPPADLESYGDGGWEDEYSARPKNEGSDSDLTAKLAELFEAELPTFYSKIGREALSTARINRRVSWLEINESFDSATYATSDGRVALIGDAAHAVVPTMGEGCNMALTSAVALVDSLPESSPPTVEELSKDFCAYGDSRPKEVQPIQIKSAERCRLSKS